MNPPFTILGKISTATDLSASSFALGLLVTRLSTAVVASRSIALALAAIAPLPVKATTAIVIITTLETTVAIATPFSFIPFSLLRRGHDSVLLRERHCPGDLVSQEH